MDDTLETFVPLQFKRKKGKLLVDGKEGEHDTTILEAVARAMHWHALLDTGAFKSVAEIAKAEGLMPTTVGRLLRLARLAPDVVEQLMVGCQPRDHIAVADAKRHPGALGRSAPVAGTVQVGGTMSRKHYGKQTGRATIHELPTPAGGVCLETFVPWTLVKRGLKKQVITPLDAPQEFLPEATREREARSAVQDSALMRALGLAHHWQRLLDEQRAASVAEIAEAEGMDVTQVRRVLRLTLLAPEVIERLVDAPDIVLEQVMRRSWPNGWGAQVNLLRQMGRR